MAFIFFEIGLVCTTASGLCDETQKAGSRRNRDRKAGDSDWKEANLGAGFPASGRQSVVGWRRHNIVPFRLGTPISTPRAILLLNYSLLARS